MPMATYTADPDAHVAISFANVNLGEQPASASGSAPVGSGLLSGVEYGVPVPGLNDLLSAPLPDIDVSFPDYGAGSGEQAAGQTQAGYDVLTSDNEDWWHALMDAAFLGDASADQSSYAVAGPSARPEQGADLANPERAFKGEDGGVMLSMAQDDSAVVGSSSRPQQQSRPAPVHAHTMPSYSHGLPSPEPFVPAETFDQSQAQSQPQQQQQRRPRASSSAYPVQSGSGSYAEPSYAREYSEQTYVPQQPAQQQEEVHFSPFAMIARAPASRRATTTGGTGSWAPPPPPAAPAPAPRPTMTTKRAPQFPSPSGAAQFPSPSGNVPQQRGFPHTNTAAPPTYYPPPPFFTARKTEKEKEKDSEAFDFSGWGSQYAAQQPPTPAEDTVRRGCVPAVTN
ncbi:hypothetical protein FRC12_022507 [Ceratobasidium sp. 428]|nr:hypothetical protein FRC12_022507 [Ceratobasidium sp. 428]